MPQSVQLDGEECSSNEMESKEVFHTPEDGRFDFPHTPERCKPLLRTINHENYYACYNFNLSAGVRLFHEFIAQIIYDRLRTHHILLVVAFLFVSSFPSNLFKGLDSNSSILPD